MKLTSVLVFAAVAGMCIVSAVSFDSNTYDFNGEWYVIGIGYKPEITAGSRQPPRCWHANITAPELGAQGSGVTYFINPQGESKEIGFKFHNIVPGPGSDQAIIAVSQKMTRSYRPKGDMAIELINEDLVILKNNYIKKLNFAYFILSRDPSLEYASEHYQYTRIDNSCADICEPY